MNSSIYRFTLDMHSIQSQISIPVSLGDTGRVWYISFADGGMPYTIPDGVLAKISIKRQTGSTLEAFCAIERNTTVKYDFAADEITVNTAVVPGIHDITVTLYNEDGRILGSPRFTMVVSDRVINSDDIVLTDEDITALDAMLVKEAARQVAETERGNAETARQEAEEERQTAFEEAMETLEKKKPRIAEVVLVAENWAGEDSPYSQELTIEGVTEYSKVDLLPSVEQLAIFHEKDIAFVTENVDGVITVYAIGDKPENDYTVQVAITEVRE